MSKYFTAECKLEAAKLVVDQQYTFAETAKAMNVSLSALTRWVSLNVKVKSLAGCR